jgi:replicative DNA helicase
MVGETKTLTEALHDAFTRLDGRIGKDNLAISGLATGYVDLDNLLAGLQNSELVIVAARPSVGKTAFALNLVRNIAVEHTEEKSPVVLLVSLEMSRVELAERLLCCQARVDSHKVRKGHLNSDDIQKLMDAGDVLRKARLYLDDTPSRSMIQIAATARRIQKKHERDGGLRLVVIDYLQLIDPENRRDPRQEQVAQISRRLKFLARELAIPVIALAQVNRASEDRQDHKPRLADLRESGSLEQDADTCMILHRPGKFDGTQDDNILEVIIAKQRNGPTGEVTLTYLKQFNRFENYIADAGYSDGGL